MIYIAIFGAVFLVFCTVVCFCAFQMFGIAANKVIEEENKKKK